MSIVENRPANVLTRSDLPSDLTMAPGAPSSITEFLRQETRERDRRRSGSSFITIEFVSIHRPNSQRFEGRLIVPGDSGRSTHLDPVAAWQRVIGSARPIDRLR